MKPGFSYCVTIARMKNAYDLTDIRRLDTITAMTEVLVRRFTGT